MNPLVLVVDDEPDVEVLLRQQFRRDLRTDRFTMEFAQSAPMSSSREHHFGFCACFPAFSRAKKRN